MTPLRYTRQALADALQAWVAMNQFGHWVICEGPFEIESAGLWKERATSNMWLVPSFIEITDPPTDWRESPTPPRTDAEPEMCEWREVAYNEDMDAIAWSTSCESYEVLPPSALEDPLPGGVDRRVCGTCSRPIRIVEDDNG